MNIFIHYFADSYRKKKSRNLIRFLSKQKTNNLLRQKKMKFTLPRLAEKETEISQIWAAKIMPNLFTVKLYLQIKVIPLSMSLMLNTKVSVNSCLFKKKKETRWILLVWILIVSNIYDPCLIWQYGLWSFQTGGTKLERFLPPSEISKTRITINA